MLRLSHLSCIATEHLPRPSPRITGPKSPKFCALKVLEDLQGNSRAFGAKVVVLTLKVVVLALKVVALMPKGMFLTTDEEKVVFLTTDEEKVVFLTTDEEKVAFLMTDD